MVQEPSSEATAVPTVDGGPIGAAGGGPPVDGAGEDAVSPQDLAVQTVLGGRTVAVAESFTGGLLAARLVAVPGSGQWLRGAIVAYASDVKFDVLGVREGPVVCSTAAEQMAAGVCRLFDAEIGLATTGVAGPARQEDQPVGTAWFGWSVGGATGRTTGSMGLRFDGDPDEIREAAVAAVLGLLSEVLPFDSSPVSPDRPDPLDPPDPPVSPSPWPPD